MYKQKHNTKHMNTKNTKNTHYQKEHDIKHKHRLLNKRNINKKRNTKIYNTNKTTLEHRIRQTQQNRKICKQNTQY